VIEAVVNTRRTVALLLVIAGMMALPGGVALYAWGRGHRADGSTAKFKIGKWGSFEFTSKTIGAVLALSAFLWGAGAVVALPGIKSTKYGLEVAGQSVPRPDLGVAAFSIEAPHADPSAVRDRQKITAEFKKAALKKRGMAKIADGQAVYEFNLGNVDAVQVASGEYAIRAQLTTKKGSAELLYGVMKTSQGGLDFVPVKLAASLEERQQR
jgi:hypothetical protein